MYSCKLNGIGERILILISILRSFNDSEVLFEKTYTCLSTLYISNWIITFQLGWVTQYRECMQRPVK